MRDHTFIGVLGPVVAWNESSHQIDLKGPRHRAVLARLIVARGRVVPVDVIVDDLWVDPPAGATSAIRTFVSALRRALEPDRAPRTKPKVIVTEGPGYAFHAAPDAVDAWKFERLVREAAESSPARSLELLRTALQLWRGPAYAEFIEESWARSERSRLEELRLTAVERMASTQLDLGQAAEAIPDLDAHVTEQPWREDGWRLLALALYRSDRQGDALAVLRRARKLLAEELGIDPGPRLTDLESNILRRESHLNPVAAEKIFAQVSAAYDRTVAAGSKSRLESTVGLLRSLAVTGGSGLETARNQRLTIIGAAEQVDDVELTARIIGNYDVPGIWTRSDDPRQAAQIVEAAQRTLDRLPDGDELARARLLATIALESRGLSGHRGLECARAAVQIGRALDDPGLLAFALNGLFMQTFWTTGLASERDNIGRELVDLAIRHGLATFEILGHLIRMQALSAMGQFDAAGLHAGTVDRLAGRHERPLAAVFTTWFRAMRAAATGAEAAHCEKLCEAAAVNLSDSGMPGLEDGILSLAILSLRVWRGLPARFDAATQWGPYEPWARPHVLLAHGKVNEAAQAVDAMPDPPKDLLSEALWCLTAAAAIAVGDSRAKEQARAALLPAAAEIAGAGSGMLTAGPVSHYLAKLG
ncbi:BTAD domain-containing putative transcriptional regulator [Rhodococcus erythropolis]|uniref:AfsR/SARP family transcriptional regulator n=1 Tax=Rhodococcus erythropolis TaxID=1833 RepID=UPI001E4DFC09|nr:MULTISPECIES: BTAD domain-containing putative transcriptional regulator [Rhodococcus erythropolis group]MCD2107184.1 winged helix-turn-helix domain-containing protein [Rhodococcus qingshengii]MCZ4526613.1 BTAD domain-containing putative transcriptional regulator [Rhodococcus erythropolis]